MQIIPSRSTGWALAALALPVLMASMATSIANVALPTLAGAFDASFAFVQWIVLAYLVANTAFLVTVGRLGDVLGKRRALVAGLATFTLASVLCAAAPSLWMLIAARAMQGTGAAILAAVALAFVGETVAKERTGRAMGLLGTISALGTALGPALGGVLIAGGGWRSVFLVSLPFAVASGLLAWRYLPDDRAVQVVRAPFDRAGALVLAVTVASFAVAVTWGGRAIGAANFALLVLAALGAIAFVVIERRAISPLVPTDLLRDARVRAGAIGSMLVAAVVMATLVIGPFHLAGALGLDAARVGLVMSCGPIVAALAGIPAGRLVDRVGASRMVIAGLVAMAMGTALMSLMAVRGGVAGYVAALVVITAGYALFQAANTTAVMTSATKTQRGVMSGLLQLARNLGLVSGASVMGALFALGMAAGEPGAASADIIAAATQRVFAIGTATVIVALVVAAIAERSVRGDEAVGEGSSGRC